PGVPPASRSHPEPDRRRLLPARPAVSGGEHTQRCISPWWWEVPPCPDAGRRSCARPCWSQAAAHRAARTPQPPPPPRPPPPTPRAPPPPPPRAAPPAPPPPRAPVASPDPQPPPQAPQAPGRPPSSQGTSRAAFLHAVFDDNQALWQREFHGAGLTYRPAR